MKKLFITSILSAAALMINAAENPNPALKLFDQDVKFYVSFDNGTCVADMAEGKAEPVAVSKGARAPEFTDGLFGKALKKGSATYKADLNLDLSASGTLIVWVTPVWDQKKPANGKEPGFTVFGSFAKGPQYNYNLILGKTWNQPWGHGHINSYVQYIPAKKYKLVNNMNYNYGRTSTWPAGEWRMFVVTWSPGTITNSVNGSKSKVAQLKNLLNGKTQNFNFGVSGQIIIDEAVILGRALTDEEIAKLYAESKAIIDKNKK